MVAPLVVRSRNAPLEWLGALLDSEARMTLKEVSSVIDDINEWENPRGGSVFYVTAIFTDESVGSVGRKDHDAALEVQGLLRESIGVEQDFTLEPAGQTKTGREKFKIKGFGTPGGAATYTAPGVQGGGTADQGSRPTAVIQPRPEPFGRTPEHFAAEAALNGAIQLLRPMQEKHETGEVSHSLVVAVADWMYDWLRKTSEPALSEYRQVEDDSPSLHEQAGAGSDDSSAEAFSSLSTSADSATGGGVETKGKEPAPSPATHRQVLTNVSTPMGHQHDWQPHPQLRGKLACDCGQMRSKASLEKEPTE